jgi:hypothetical protein
MFSKASVLMLTVLISSAVLSAEGWREKPFDEWTEKDVSEILLASPWVFTSKASFPAPDTPRVGQIAASFPVIRLLTAKPIRLAYLRVISLYPSVDQAIDVRDLPVDRDPKIRQKRLERFIQFNPDHLLVNDDSKYIILSMTMSQVVTASLTRPASREEITKPEELSEIHLVDLLQTTFLATQRGKRVSIAQFAPPAIDSLGAKFFFPRSMSDGSAFISQGDTELRFETSINGKRLKARFDLRKLVYQGKIEI